VRRDAFPKPSINFLSGLTVAAAAAARRPELEIESVNPARGDAGFVALVAS
jgi:hypothetical protein